MQKIKFDFEATKERIYAPNSNVPIGAPVDRNGNIANDGNAYGIVLCKETENEKYWVRYNLVVMVAGYCDIIDAQEIWGDEYSAEAIAAMSDIVFCDDHKIGGGGGWPADLPKPSVGGYGYTEQGWTTLVSEAVTTTMTAQLPFASGEFATSGLEIKGGTTYKVVFNGVEYELTAVKDNGQTYIGDLDETQMPNFNTYPFCILQDIVDSPILMATVSSGTHDVTVQWESDIVHKIDGKYLPEAGGGGGMMIVNGHWKANYPLTLTLDKTVDEILAAAPNVAIFCDDSNVIIPMTNYDERNKFYAFRLIIPYLDYYNREGTSDGYECFSVIINGEDDVVYSYNTKRFD